MDRLAHACLVLVLEPIFEADFKGSPGIDVGEPFLAEVQIPA